MKKLLCVGILSVSLLGSVGAFANLPPQEANHEKKQQGKTRPKDWKELEQYHEVMGATFHPMEEGNLQPVRTRANELALKATAWVKSTPPKEFDQPKIKETLIKLEAESKALADLVSKKGSDEEVKKSLTALHDRFHEVVVQCRDHVGKE